MIPPATTPIDVSTNKIAQAPEWTGSFGVDYSLEVSGLGTLNATVDYTYQDTTHFQDVNLTNQSLSNTLDPTTTQEAYGLVNARVGIDNVFGSNVSVDIWGRNIGDELYYVQMSNSGTLGLSNGQPGMPQTFGATIRATF